MKVKTKKLKKLSGTDLIKIERNRQICVKKRTSKHDDKHFSGELACAAACYTLGERIQSFRGFLTDVGFEHEPRIMSVWPWSHNSWKPKSRIRNLVKAGALIAAEIDRLQREGKE